MPGDVLSNWAGNAALQFLLGNGGFLAIHLADPTAAGLFSTEASGGGYGRQAIHFASPSGRTAVSTDNQIFPGLSALTAEYLAVWTLVSGGEMIFAKQLIPTISVPESGQLLVAIGDIALRFP